MIQNYIFDFGNVLANFYEEMLTEPYVPDAKLRKTISEVVFDRAYWDRLDDGSITDEEVRTEIRRRLPEEHWELGCLVYDSWVKTLTPVPGMEKLVFDLKKAGKKLYLLSNISIGFAESYREVPWLEKLLGCFDGVVFSGMIAMVKPNREIFTYLLDTYSLKPEECLFVDDRKENLQGAETAGIRGYLFQGDAEKLRKYLGV
ncbi:MAG: HAD family phosphatase [Clostridia bacterium]|nr:HAD family phosphatase [Clostridia bacterium]